MHVKLDYMHVKLEYMHVKLEYTHVYKWKPVQPRRFIDLFISVIIKTLINSYVRVRHCTLMIQFEINSKLTGIAYM